MPGCVRLQAPIPIPREPPMTAEMMSRHGMLGTSADAERLRAMIGFAAERLIELKVGGPTWANDGEKSVERLV